MALRATYFLSVIYGDPVPYIDYTFLIHAGKLHLIWWKVHWDAYQVLSFESRCLWILDRNIKGAEHLIAFLGLGFRTQVFQISCKKFLVYAFTIR